MNKRIPREGDKTASKIDASEQNTVRVSEIKEEKNRKIPYEWIKCYVMRGHDSFSSGA